MTPRPVYSVIDRLRVAQLRLASVALVIMMVMTLADIFLRYVFNSPIRGAYELVEAMMAIFMFHGMSTSFLLRRNIVIDLIDSFAPRALITVLIRTSDVLTIATIVMFAYAMITPALQSYNYGEIKMELQVPIWYMWAAALIGIIGAIISAIGALIGRTDTSSSDEPI
jgi:TRAP-type C4-dicarboxylate transport system permease small subunit